MQKYLAVFVILFIVLTRCAESTQSEENSKKTLEELKLDLIKYEEKIGRNEEKLRNLECEMEQDAKRLENGIKKLQSKLQANIPPCSSANLSDLSKIIRLESENKEYEKNLSTISDELNTCRNAMLPDSCLLDGVVSIKVPNADAFRVRCDTKILNPGWMIIQRRVVGKLRFNRNWTDYKNGFGDLNTEFFIGLENLHRITNAQQHELYIQLTVDNNTKYYAQYDDFKIGDEQSKYALKSLGIYSGNVGIFKLFDEPMEFSTCEQDNNNSGGGWWFRKSNLCWQNHLNGMQYEYIYISGYYVKATHMMIRPKKR